jgi:hypothetical protein
VLYWTRILPLVYEVCLCHSNFIQNVNFQCHSYIQFAQPVTLPAIQYVASNTKHGVPCFTVFQYSIPFIWILSVLCVLMCALLLLQSQMETGIVVTSLQFGWLRNCASVAGWVKRFFFPPLYPDRLWGFLLSGYQRLFFSRSNVGGAWSKELLAS